MENLSPMREVIPVLTEPSFLTGTTQRVLFSDSREFQDRDTRNSVSGVVNTPIPERFVTRKTKRNYSFQTRRPASPKEVSQLRLKRLEKSVCLENPFEEFRRCCKRGACFQNVDKVHAFHWFRALMNMEREQYKSTLLSWYNPIKEQFEFDGRRVCWRFLYSAFGFSNDLLSSVRGTAGSRAAQTAFTQPRERRARSLQDSIVEFLKFTAEACGEKMPHRQFINLPFSTRQQVHAEYIEYFRKHDPLRFSHSPAQLSHFYTTWVKFVPDVKVLKRTGFMRCSDCVYFEEERKRNIHNPAALRLLKDASSQHYREVAEERQGYEMRKQICRRDPKNSMSLVVDGADQSNYGLPHFRQRGKDDKGHKMTVKVVGVIIHGTENNLFLFSMVEGFETGANHVIESVHRALNIKKIAIGKLPPVLFVQADNCTRENKNRYFLSYLEMLVRRGVFTEVQMSAVEIGHTHTDIDQSFSCVHKRLDNNDAHCLRELHEQMRKSYAPAPYVEELSRVANFSAQCESFSCLAKVDSFAQYRYFRFLRLSDNPRLGFYDTKCCVKRKLSDEWKPLRVEKGQHGFLKSVPDLLNMPPTVTKVMPNVRNVNECLKAAEPRIRSESVMGELYD